jgi:Nickel/cobalt transporter regulator
MRSLFIAALLAATTTTPAMAQMDRGDGAAQESRGDFGRALRSRLEGMNQRRDAAPPPQSAPPPQAAQQVDPGRGGWQRGGGNWNRGGEGGQAARIPQQAPQAFPQADANRGWNRGGGNWGGNRGRDEMTVGHARDDHGEGRRRWDPQNGGQGRPDQGHDGRFDRHEDHASNGGFDRRGGQRWGWNGGGNGGVGWRNDRHEDRRDNRDDGHHDNRGWRNNNGWNHGNTAWGWNRGDSSWGWNRGYDRGSNRGWDRGWRNDDRYDWHSYRNRYGDRFRQSRYYDPYGSRYGYRGFGIGIRIDSLFYGSRYWISDPWAYRLPDPPYGCRWVRYYDDALLVDMRSGYVIDVINDIFW